MEEAQRGHEAIYKSSKRIIIDNFFGGLAWGLGTVIGAGAIVAILAFLISQVNFIPGIGSFVAQIIEAVNKSSQNSPFTR